MALSGTVPHGTPKFHGWLEFPHLNGHNSGVIYMPKKGGCNFDPVREKGGGGCERMCIPLRTKTKSYKQLHYAPLPIPLGKNGPFLVGGIPTPLKNMSSSVGIILPNIFQKKRPRPCDQFQMVPNVRNPRAHAMAHVSQQHQGLKNDGTTGTLL